MITYAIDEFIDRPPQAIFPYLADPGRHAAWMDVAEARLIDDGPTHQGSRIQSVLRKGPIRLPLEYEVSEFEPDRTFGYRTLPGRIRWDGDFTLTPEGGGTRITSTGTVELHGLLKLLTPLVRGEVRNGEGVELKKLKALVESET